MANILEELWRGNVVPYGSVRHTPEMTQLMGYIARHHEKLTSNLTGELKETFEKLDDCWNEYAELCDREVFIFGVVLIVGDLLALWGLKELGEYLTGFPLGTYICVLVYTILLAIMSSDAICKMFFLDRMQNINSIFSAFKAGYTRAASHMFVFYMPIKPIIYSLYLLCLIVSQIVSMGYAFLSDEVVAFCQLNEYGIVILIAIQEMINSWKKKAEKKELISCKTS